MRKRIVTPRRPATPHAGGQKLICTGVVSLHRIHLRFHEAEWRANALKFGDLEYALACSFAAAGDIVEEPDVSL